MTEQFLKDLVVAYGPLSLGWPLAWYFIKQNVAISDKFHTALVASTEAKLELKNAVDNIAEVLRATEKANSWK